MAVYRPKDRFGKEAEAFKYDFQLGGVRYAGSTGATTEREALKVERAERARAQKEQEERKKAGGDLWTWGKAASVYFKEVMNEKFDATSKSWFLWLQDHIGLRTPIRDIDTPFIQRLMMTKLAKAKGRGGGPVSNITLNRSVQEPIQRILRHANSVHLQPLAQINWKAIKRKEPKVRIRELRGTEETVLMQHVREDYQPFIRFCLISGLRIHEAVKLRWSDIDFDTKQVYIFGKGEKPATVPLPPSLEAVILPLRGHHPEYVFTFISHRTVKHHGMQGLSFEKGKRYPLTKGGAQTAWAGFRDEAGIKDFRFHDLRHTALSRIVRATKDLQAAQKIGRHENIATTMRYAHVLDEDVFAAMEAGARLLGPSAPSGDDAASPTKSPTNGDGDQKKAS